MNVQDSEFWEEQITRLAPFMRPTRNQVALVLAHQYRRGRARNATAERGLGQKFGVPMLSGPNADLFVFYEMLEQQERVDAASENLLEMLELRREEYEILRSDLDHATDLDEKRVLLAEMMDKADEMEELTGLMEKLSGAD